ncbi:Potassium voltage-gated channel subfamily H member 7 [Araneus ventricosus]|uniref:Potassium voltage-gated channel subfamily H member 7 n=1 Tax=Araneus ventricosus TaxID=182803 RepID=A0A4Y2JIL1_ARAVE|nr:Potassium voltage-gated channel subfamily H member 7 [Araneus ventricosus]
MQKPATCDFLHGPLTSSQATAQIRESLTTCLEKQLEIIYYRKDGTKFLCSQVTAPIKNEEGEISMFIMNFEDITDAPYRDEVVTPCTSPLMSARSKSLRLWLPSLLRRGSEVKIKEGDVDPDPETVALDTFDPHMHLWSFGGRALSKWTAHTAPPRRRKNGRI